MSTAFTVPNGNGWSPSLGWPYAAARRINTGICWVVPAQDLVPQHTKPSPGISLGRLVQRVLQGTHLVSRKNSAVATPRSPSRLDLQYLHRFPGLRPLLPGLALSRLNRLRPGDVTTRQASLHATDRSVAHPQTRGARRWASTPGVPRPPILQPATGPPGR
jgi:hypothetical protein